MIRIAAVGDLFPGEHYFCLGHGVLSQIADPGLAALIRVVTDVLAGVDIAFANLECPLSAHSENPVGYRSTAFLGTPSTASKLNEVGFDVVSVANNHILQHGLVAAQETVSHLKAAGVLVVGIRSPENPFYCMPCRIEVEGKTVCFLGYSSVPEQYMPGQSFYCEWDKNRILDDIRLAKSQADFVIVSYHGGTEASGIPSDPEVNRLRGLVDAGADVILGHHTHVLQPIDVSDGKIICFGLGNFLFDLFWADEMMRGGIFLFSLGASGAKPERFIRTRYEERGRLEILDSVDMSDGNHSEAWTRYAIDEHLPAQKYDNAKIRYFLKNIHRGYSRQKINFLIDKLRSRMSG